MPFVLRLLLAINFDTVQRCVSQKFRESLNRYKVATTAKKSSCESSWFSIFDVIVEFDPHDPDDHDFEQTCRYGVSETACKQGSTNSKSNGGCFKLVFSRIEFTKLRDCVPQEKLTLSLLGVIKL